MTVLQKIVQRSGTPSEIFEESWKKQGFDPTTQDGGANTTAPVQRVIDTENPERTEKALQTIKENRDGDLVFNKRAVKAASKLANPDSQKTMDIGEVDNFTPLVFDPEIVSILKQNAPVLDVIPEEGQEGFSAVYNIVDSREDPLGYISEADAVDLSNNTPNDIGFAKDEVDMELFVDKVNISDFTQEAAAHYMNVEDTTLGERVGLHAQRKAQQIFYGDPSQDTGTGYIGDAEGFKGLTAFASDAGNVIDKSGVSSDFVKDIKSVIRQMRQDENVNVNNLVIATSHEFFDILENEADFDNLRTDPSDQSVNVGLNQLSIGGVPVIPTHNVDSFTDGAYTPGDPGDVFIMSTRTARFRTLMPMSMVPLAKTGLSESVALAEFGALIEKSQGNFVRHLQSYNF